MSRKPSLERKNAILQAAGELFDLKGYRGVSMDAICLRCSITKPTLYYYFSDKETLYFQCMVQMLKGYKELIGDSRPVMERIEYLSALMLERMPHNIDKMMSDMDTIQDERRREQIHQVFYKELFDPVVSLFREGIEQGTFRNQALGVQIHPVLVPTLEQKEYTYLKAELQQFCH